MEYRHWQNIPKPDRPFQEFVEAYAAADAILLNLANDEAAYNAYSDATYAPLHLNAKRTLGSERAQYAHDLAHKLRAA